MSRNNLAPIEVLPTLLGYKLPLQLKQMGAPDTCAHRAGWGYVMEHLIRDSRSTGILLDDFVERTFQHEGMRHCWQEPWIGIFHHPPNLPSWFDQTAPPETILKVAEFEKSLPWLRGAIALSEHLGGWLKQQLGIPVLILKHPTEVPELQFSMNRWDADTIKTLVQVGWYARNYRGIYQVEVPETFRKVHLLQHKPWVLEAMKRTDLLSPLRHRTEHGSVDVLDRLRNDDYDQLLSSSLIFCEYLDVSASNTVIEAIARNTPIVVNRLAANVEYLGRDYPMFFDDLTDVPRLISERARIRDAHLAMVEMDKTWISGNSFAADVGRFVYSLTGASVT